MRRSKSQMTNGRGGKIEKTKRLRQRRKKL